MTGRPGAVRAAALVLGAVLIVTGLTGCGLRERGRAGGDPAGTAGTEQSAGRTKPADSAAAAGVSAADVAAVEALVGTATAVVDRGEATVAADG